MNNKRGALYIFAIAFLLVLGALFFIILTLSLEEKPSRCFEGTFEGECSELKPYYCLNQKLIENPNVCVAAQKT